jgi:hypothetical protein
MPPPIVDSSRPRCFRELPEKRRLRFKRALATSLTIIVASISAALLVNVEGLDRPIDSAVSQAVRFGPGLST